MPSSIGQSAVGSDPGNTTVTTAATAGATSTGSTVLGIVIYQTVQTVTGVTDNKGNGAYTQIGSTEADVNGSSICVWRKENATGGAGHTITATQNVSGSISAMLLEITGAAASSLDQFADFTIDAASPFTTGTTGTTAQANEIALAFYLLDRFAATTITWGNGYAEAAANLVDANVGVLGVGFKNLSSTGTQQCSVTLSAGSETAGMVATFIDAGGATVNAFGQRIYVS
jgi:hypothetical protein